MLFPFFFFIIPIFSSIILLTSSVLPSAPIPSELGFSLPVTQTISSYDTHGFHGDGISCDVYDFSSTPMPAQITSWSPFPPDDTVQALLYGWTEENAQEITSIGPFLTDDNGDPLVPKITNGYYLLIDRQEETTTPLLSRPSLDFTLAVYDSDKDTLYYCKMDT